MSLFQPTNITPDILNGLGNGTIDVTQALTVSWQVNGNSPMTQWRIRIYPNTVGASAILTRSATLTTPFYGVDYEGNVQMFSVTIPSSVLTAAGMTNGNEYQMVITQYWSSTEYIVQRSASVFKTRSLPSVTISNMQILNTCEYTFTASYTQSEGDTIAWMRWMIADSNDIDNPFYDTGKVYTQELKCYYDGFLNGHIYQITVSIETENGIQAINTQTTVASWTTVDLPGEAVATKINNQSSAVKVSWGGFRYIDPNITGSYTLSNGMLGLPTGSNVYWNDENGSAMSLGTPWYLLYKTTLQGANAVLFSLDNGASTGQIQFKYTYSTRKLSLTINGSTAASLTTINPDDTLWVILTEDSLYVRRYGYKNALVPSESQTPTATLTPSQGRRGVTLEDVISLTYTQDSITKVQIYGKQLCDYIQIVNGTITQDVIDQVYTNGTYVPANEQGTGTIINGTVFLADFSNDLEAGTLTIGGQTITGWAIYRKRYTETIAKHVANVSLSTSSILDYGCASEQGDYTYYVYPIGDAVYITGAFESNSINPIFWNWSIIECAKTDDKHYSVVNEYVFRDNVSSGSISNNNSPSVLANFTRFPTVQMSHANYQSGTLTGLIGQVGYMSYIVQAGDTAQLLAERFNVTAQQIIDDNEISDARPLIAGMTIKIYFQEGILYYRDDITLRNKIWALSTTENTLFLKNRKGDLIEVRPSGPITMTTQDNTREQVQAISLPWVQVGQTEDVYIIGLA